MSMGVDAGEAVDLRGYRLRYAQYKAEQPLRLFDPTSKRPAAH